MISTPSCVHEGSQSIEEISMSKKGKDKNSKKKSTPEPAPMPKDSSSGEVEVASEAKIAADTRPIGKSIKVDKGSYAKELRRLQVELVKLQEWVRTKGLKVVVIFEGRDAAGKGGVIKRITESLNPRICRIVALPAPTER